MDESVIFVQELRSGDSDISVFESEETGQISSNPSRKAPKRQCKKSYELIPIIDLTKDRDSENFEVQTKYEKVDLKNSKPSNTKSKTNEKGTPKSRLECPICLESLQNLEVKLTNCGHLYCKDCLDVIINQPRPNCPKCREVIIKKQLRRVFL